MVKSTASMESSCRLGWRRSQPSIGCPVVSEVLGLQAFIFDLIGELLDARGDLVPILVEEVIHSLTQEACPQPHGCTIGQIIIDVLTGLIFGMMD